MWEIDKYQARKRWNFKSQIIEWLKSIKSKGYRFSLPCTG